MSENAIDSETISKPAPDTAKPKGALNREGQQHRKDRNRDRANCLYSYKSDELHSGPRELRLVQKPNPKCIANVTAFVAGTFTGRLKRTGKSASMK
jgi:hypothetical protein